MEFTDTELMELIRALSVAISEIDRADWRELLMKLMRERAERRRKWLEGD